MGQVFILKETLRSSLLNPQKTAAQSYKEDAHAHFTQRVRGLQVPHGAALAALHDQEILASLLAPIRVLSHSSSLLAWAEEEGGEGGRGVKAASRASLCREPGPAQ